MELEFVVIGITTSLDSLECNVTYLIFYFRTSLNNNI